MNGSKLEAQNPIKTLLNHAKNVNSYQDSATPLKASSVDACNFVVQIS